MAVQSRLAKQWRFRSMLLILVCAAVVPLVLVAGLLMMRLGEEQNSSSERRLLQSARAQAIVVDRELAATIRTLEALSVSDTLNGDDYEAITTKLRRVVLTQPSWYSVNVAGLDGRIIVNTRSDGNLRLGSPVVEPASFEKVVNTRAPVVGTLRASPPGRRDAGRWAFPVRVPVMRNGELRYILTAVLTPESLADLVVRQLPPTEEFTRTIVDTGNTVVARTRRPELFVGQKATSSFVERTSAAHEGVYRETTLEGAPVYLAFSHGPVYGWTSSLAVPVAAVAGPARGSVLALAFISTAGLLLSGLAVFALARRVNRDLLHTTMAAEALARGEQPESAVSVVAEIDRVNAALRHSGELLVERERERDEHLARATTALDAARTANRMKDEFLAMLGHELRNPLAPIVTALEVARLRSPEVPPEHTIISRQVRHLTRLVDDLLDVSRITRGKVDLKLETLEIQPMVARAIEMTSPLFEARLHEVVVDVPAHGLRVHGDPVRLTQVFANVIGNAAKYTPAGGWIGISAGRVNDQVRIRVRDTGQGIAPDLLPQVFDLFVQGPMGADRRDGGLGLGLTLARSLVLLHHGTIEAASEGTSRGTTVEITLPMSDRSPAEVRSSARFTTAPNPLRILVVDDNEDAAEMLAETLRMYGHEVMTAHDGPSALARAVSIRPDVAVLDLGLPVMDGYELAHGLRERLGQLAPRCIAVTGYGQDGDKARTAAAGFAAHLVKPVEMADLLAALASAPTSRQES